MTSSRGQYAACSVQIPVLIWTVVYLQLFWGNRMQRGPLSLNNMMMEARKNHSEWHVAVEGLARGAWKTTRLSNTAKVNAAVTKETMQPLQTIFNELPTDSCFHTALCLMFYETQLFKIRALSMGKIYVEEYTDSDLHTHSSPTKGIILQSEWMLCFWFALITLLTLTFAYLKLVKSLSCGSVKARQKNNRLHHHGCCPCSVSTITSC